MEDEQSIEAFRLRFRVTLLEHLILKSAFAAPVLARRLSAEESQLVLKGWLTTNSEEADKTYGAAFGDPALAALYSDEVKSVTDKMSKIVDELYNEWKSNPF